MQDNASNTEKAMEDLGVASLDCFAHLLQPVMQKGAAVRMKCM